MTYCFIWWENTVVHLAFSTYSRVPNNCEYSSLHLMCFLVQGTYASASSWSMWGRHVLAHRWSHLLVCPTAECNDSNYLIFSNAGLKNKIHQNPWFYLIFRSEPLSFIHVRGPKGLAPSSHFAEFSIIPKMNLFMPLLTLQHLSPFLVSTFMIQFQESCVQSLDKQKSSTSDSQFQEKLTTKSQLLLFKTSNLISMILTLQTLGIFHELVANFHWESFSVFLRNIYWIEQSVFTVLLNFDQYISSCYNQSIVEYCSPVMISGPTLHSASVQHVFLYKVY